ncbi:translation elongation factor Ts [Rhodocytophaga aerolata]|uniref:Elongation factor Ts n=1 Tax=Rhodocytophaga aerolata TaxID=455078 RepID=A0ABT8R9B6_9BACT|nr:translation elongation factor Ts [Rhodocytophaga aerolata]MDO1447863.1 translation elongation factor Ts [Rhodocytophaga aerolata]
MAITAQDVNKLRQMTGAGMMDCKKALAEANGDFEAAIDILRKKGQKVSAARSDRQTSEGAVFIKVNDAGTKATLLALGCETDFVAKNEEFQRLGNTVLEAAVKNDMDTAGEVLALHVDGRPVAEHLTDLIGKIGEKIEIVSYEKVEGEKIVPYVHSNGKLGVLVALKNTGGADVTEAGKDVAMQIAAMRPVAVDKDEVDAATVQREIEIGKEQARAEGKPEAMLEKIAMGKLNKFYKDSTLLNQEFVKDNSKTVAQMLDSIHKGLTVSSFKRIQIG